MGGQSGRRVDVTGRTAFSSVGSLYRTAVLRCKRAFFAAHRAPLTACLHARCAPACGSAVPHASCYRTHHLTRHTFSPASHLSRNTAPPSAFWLTLPPPRAHCRSAHAPRARALPDGFPVALRAPASAGCRSCWLLCHTCGLRSTHATLLPFHLPLLCVPAWFTVHLPPVRAARCSVACRANRLLLSGTVATHLQLQVCARTAPRTP